MLQAIDGGSGGGGDDDDDWGMAAGADDDDEEGGKQAPAGSRWAEFRCCGFRYSHSPVVVADSPVVVVFDYSHTRGFFSSGSWWCLVFRLKRTLSVLHEAYVEVLLHSGQEVYFRDVLVTFSDTSSGMRWLAVTHHQPLSRCFPCDVSLPVDVQMT